MQAISISNSRSATFCVTISEYNRNYILQRFPNVDAQKILVSRLGVDVMQSTIVPTAQKKADSLNLLAVGAAWRSRYGKPSPESPTPPP